MDKLHAMRTFVAVVDAGSFVGAMAAAGLSKPAVSRQVSELEQFLGVRLLHRTTRRLSLTDEGRVYYLRCQEVLAAVADAEAELSTRVGQAQGRLRVGAPQDFGLLHLAHLWPRFLAENPQLELDIMLSDRVVDLIEEGYDLVIRIGNLPSSALVARQLTTTRIVLCAAPEYLAARGMPTHPRELEQHACVAYSYASNGNEWRLHHVASGEVATVRMRPHVHVNSGATCRVMALEGQGFIVQPDFLVHDDLRSGRLVEVLPEWRLHELAVHAVYPTRTLLPRKVQVLRDFLVESLRDPPWRVPTPLV